jgi:type I restriction enzyme S subunit
MIDQDRELPHGWKLSTLAESAALVKTRVDPAAVPGMPYVGLEHVDAHTMRLLGHGTASDVKSTKIRFSAGDVLYGKLRPYLNKVARPDFHGICSTDFLVFADSPELDRGYLANYLNQIWVADRAHQLSNGVELPRVDWKSLSQLPIAYPLSKAHQRTIVARLDAVRQAQSTASSHLAAARRAIERFRQAVLAAACSGRLTADWRERRGSVRAEALVGQLLEHYSAATMPLAEPDAELVGDVPSGWRIVTLHLLIERIDAGKSFAAEPRPATEQEWGVIKVSAMSWGRFLEAENKAVLDKKRINPTYEICPGDLLISRANTADLVGATVLVGDIRHRLLLSDKSLRLIPRTGIDKAWLNYSLRSPLVRRQFSERATGTSDSMRNLSQVKILSTTLPLPPPDEQREIGHRVDQLLCAADELQQRLEAATRRVARGVQAVLAKTFRGESEL